MSKRVLTLNLRKCYFDAIKNRTKELEYRLRNDYWGPRIKGKEFDAVVFKCGYPKKDDTERIICRQWKGYEITKSTNQWLFGSHEVNVFAIDATGDDISLESKFKQLTLF